MIKWIADATRKLFGLKTELEPAFEFETEGPELEDHPIVTVAERVALNRGAFVAGWWDQARRWPIHAKRMGGAITPKLTVVHTTDMAPGTMPALLRAWAKNPGSGAGCHFVIGKSSAGIADATPSGGVVQLIPITRNGNHAGGSRVVNGKRQPWHGWFKTKAGALVHPNLVAVGIELDNAGMLAKKGGAWVHRGTDKVIPPADVYIDERGRGWERITEYQFAALEALLDALDATMPAADFAIVPNGNYSTVPFAGVTSSRELGHVTLDPNRKTDPGPQVMAWLRERAARS